MTYVSFIVIAFGFGVVLHYIADVKRQIAHLENSNQRLLDEIKQYVTQLCRLQEDHDQDFDTGWTQILKALEDICNSLNKTYSAAEGYMDFSTHAIQHTLLCLRPFVHNSRNIAIDREDYNTAQECQRILDNLDSMIQYNLFKD